MLKRTIAIHVLLAAVSGWLAGVRADAPAAATSWRSAVVLVRELGVGGIGAGNGVVVGDGTFVATAAHAVLSQAEEGDHRATSLLEVYSPAIGDVADAFVAALDLKNDLAILKVPWRGHPALPLASDTQVRAAESGTAAAFLPADPATKDPALLVEHRIWVSTVIPQEGKPREIIFFRDHEIGRGWSGAPVILRRDGVVAGILTQVVGRRGDSVARNPFARPSRLIRELARKAGMKDDTEAHPTFTKPRDSVEAFASAMAAAKAMADDEWSAAFSAAEYFVRLRPDSANAHVALARAAAKSDRNDIAEEHYQKALELAPDSGRVHLSYGTFLNDIGKKDEAIALCRRATELLPGVALPLLVLADTLRTNGEAKEAEAVIRRAIKLEPTNAFLWNTLRNVLMSLDKPEGASKAARKAVELHPRSWPFQVALASTLAPAGDPDEAQRHFRRLLRDQRDQPLVLVAYAAFLAEYRPDRLGYALNLIDEATASNRGAELPVPSELLEKLRQELEKRLAESNKSDNGEH